MRIVGGEHRGARIFAPAGRETRPTSDRVREAAFNLIGPVDDATVLDLFAGLAAEGKTVVVVTHERDVARYAGRIVTLVDGRVSGDGAAHA